MSLKHVNMSDNRSLKSNLVIENFHMFSTTKKNTIKKISDQLTNIDYQFVLLVLFVLFVHQEK